MPPNFEADHTRLVIRQLNPDTGETLRIISAIAHVCDQCRGRGSIVNPSIDSHGISSQEFNEDPDFKKAYFAGTFDITCPSCEGTRIELHPANENSVGAIALREANDEKRGYQAEIAAERRMGA
jgi:hypothetical protein